jgi:hypothetical protein
MGLCDEILLRLRQLAYECGYLAPGFARDDHGTVLDFVSLEVKVRQSSIHGYCEPGRPERQVHTVGETLNGFNRNPGSVQFLADVGSDFEFSYLECGKWHGISPRAGCCSVTDLIECISADGRILVP